jgi:hypothetical protein
MQLRNISLVLAVALLSPASLVAQRGRPATQPTRLEVVDGNGNTVGIATSIETAGLDMGQGTVALLAGPDGEAAPIIVRRNQWSGTNSVFRYYASTDCSGQAYIPFFEDSLVPATAGGYMSTLEWWRTTLWVQSGPPETHTFQSWAYDTCAPIAPSTGTLVPATPTTLMDEFVFPFSVRVVR